MDMVAHQAVTHDADSVAVRVAPQQAQVEDPVGIAEEDRLLMIPALGRVVPDSRDDHPYDSCHSSGIVPDRG
jgi:hypothetical protein